MRNLAKSLIVVVPAFLAGFLAWLFLPCQPERSVLMPAGTKLLEFSPAGRYVLTFQRAERRLTLWQTDTGQATFEAETPCLIPANVSTNGARAFYGFSTDDRRLAVTTGGPDEPRLVIVDLPSGNTLTPIAELPPNPDKYRPRPAFSSDDRYLSYFSEDAKGQECAVLYDIAGQQEWLRVPAISSSLGPPTRQGKWLLSTANGIELWDLAQRRREATLPPWPPGWSMMSTSLTPDEQAVTALCFVFSPFPQEHIVLYRCDLTTRKIEKEWEYALPLSAQPALWNIASSDPDQFLLIKTRDDNGKLVQDLLDISTGKVLARYPEPIDMLENISLSHIGQTVHYGSGLTHTLGRNGEMAIDSQRQILVSKQLGRENPSWQYFDIVLGWLGIKPGPPRLYVQFHSVQTGQLLERVSLRGRYLPVWGDPWLALHPSQPLLAVVDEHESSSQLQIWRVPPPRPWGLIAACGLAAAGFASLIRFSYSKLRKRKAISQPNSG